MRGLLRTGGLSARFMIAMAGPSTPHNSVQTVAGNTIEPAMIEPARFARDGSCLTGSATPAQLPRVADVLFDESGTVGYRIEGALTFKGEPELRLGLAIDVVLPCQRCLERLPIQLNVARTLVLSRGLDELAAVEDEEDDIDAIPLVSALDVLDLIDQEVMLSLPIAPRHPDGECEARHEGDQAPQASPFSVLAQLKQT
jgi:uncharacterized protein